MLLLLIMTMVFVFFVLVYARYMLVEQTRRIKNLSWAKKNLQQELKTVQEKIHHVMEDSLTHLPGWEIFEDRLNQNILESERYELIMAVMFVSLGDFKMMTEALGLKAGNEVLIEASKRLRESVRQVDTVSRYGPDVFAVILTRLSKPESAVIVVERILQSFSAGITVGEEVLNINANIGVAIYPVDGKDAATLLSNADHALHLAKQHQKTCQFYHGKIHEASRREYLLSAGLKSEHLMDELVIDFHPVINSQEKKIIFYEAAVTWQHPSLGLIHAGELMDEAERHGKANTLTLGLLGKTCLDKQAPGMLGMCVSVQQLQNSQFIFEMSKLLKTCRFDANNLVLEIRNASQNISWDVLEKATNMLKYQQIKLAVNDFGMNAFSISQLKNLSLDYLCIDNNLIQDVGDNPKTQDFVKAMLALARSLSMQIIVKHVESREHMEVLARLGCFLVQGDFVTRWLQETQLTEKI